jgi:ADP-heptose:LPS heptosyltransferase
LSFKRILVFRIGHLGDTLVALPALWALRSALPDAEIVYLSNSDTKNPHYLSAQGILPQDGLFDDWLSYPNLSGGIGDIFQLLKLAIELRRRKFDAVIYLMTRNRTAPQIDRDRRFFRFAGISKMLGADFLKIQSLGLSIPKPVPRIERESDFLLSLLREEKLIADDRSFRTDLLISKGERDTAQEWLQASGALQGGRKLIAVAPGSKWDSKIWDETRFGEVVDRLIVSHDVSPIVFGGPEDRDKGERLIARWKRGANAAGALNVREAAAALEMCSLYLGNDTGTMHLAATVGTPCVAIFAAIDWSGRWEPFGAGHTIFRRTVECEGCHTPLCFNEHKCLDLVNVDEVFAACESLLSSRIVTRAVPVLS